MDAARPPAAPSALEDRLTGTRARAVRDEFLGASATFPLANLLFEWLREGWHDFIRSPDPWALLATAFVQAWFLGTRRHEGRPSPILGNLVGPAFYTLVEGALEGPRFFEAPHHLAYWGFAIAIGLAQSARLRSAAPWARFAATLAENALRAAIVLVMYALFEALDQPAKASLAAFMADASHLYVAASLLALGLVIGIAQSHADGDLRLLRETASQLRRYSELAMGKRVLEAAVADSASLAPTRRDRAIAFLDLRGFTAWSDRQSPEAVVAMLDDFYGAVEDAAAPHDPVRIKFTADEAMIVFADPRAAVRAALALRAALTPRLAPFGLAAGIGLHRGPVVEGLLGSRSVKAYDVLGDTANVAKRLCDQAGPGEILASDALPLAEAGAAVLRRLVVKGKAEAVTAFALAPGGGAP